MAGGSGTETFTATVRYAQPPKLLEYTWGEDVLRWELDETLSGTRLTLRHTTQDRTVVPKLAAGWHICLDVADELLAGRPISRVVADDARQHGWGQLNDGYATRLGIPNTGWPLG